MVGSDYETALAELRRDVVGLGERACERTRDGVMTLDRGDADLARTVATSDDAIDDQCLAIEADCVDLLATGEPIAGDLRFVVASLQICTDLERIGDLATNLGEYALADGSRLEGLEVARLGADATDLVEAALDAYEDGDADACRSVAERDDRVDARCQTAGDRLLRELVAGDGPATDPWDVEWLLDDVSRALLAIRDLERIADHGVNVAARTLYAVENDPGLL